MAFTVALSQYNVVSPYGRCQNAVEALVTLFVVVGQLRIKAMELTYPYLGKRGLYGEEVNIGQHKKSTTFLIGGDRK